MARSMRAGICKYARADMNSAIVHVRPQKQQVLGRQAMRKIILATATVGMLAIFAASASAADYYWSIGSGYGSHYWAQNHAWHHNDLDHRAFHRELGHRAAHRYPMTYWQHDRLHDQLNHESFHDYLDHRSAHRSGAYRPYSTYRYGFGICRPGY